LLKGCKDSLFYEKQPHFFISVIKLNKNPTLFMRILKFLLRIFICIALVFLVLIGFRGVFVSQVPTTFRTQHFIVTYQGVFAGEAQDMATALEQHYDRIRNELGDPKHDTIQVHLYGRQNDFNEGTGLINSHANGTSRGPNAFHVLWTTWANSILPDDPIKTAVHEFTHCVQLNILVAKAQREMPYADAKAFNKAFEEKFARDYPQWFWESLCDYQAGIRNKISINYGMRHQPTLAQLNDGNHVYLVGTTIIEYIVHKWGKDKLSALITSYGNIPHILKVSEAEFEKGWREYVHATY
jgi:hypothetical protein